MEIQLDFFNKELNEIDLLRLELRQTQIELSNTRRGLFSRYDALGQIIMRLTEKIENK
jgi:hypothetical protein